jgi:hypothetical protein
MLTRKGWFDSNFRYSVLLRAKMLHGGALDYGSSKQPTTTLAALAWHPLRVYKQSRFDSDLRPQVFCLRSSNVEHAILNRRVASSSLAGGTG